jgi:S-adenosylmethionine synthetase
LESFDMRMTDSPSRTPVRIQEDLARGPGDGEVEMVERKGLGHPDSIADAVMEAVSRGLSRAYLDEIGRVAHYNCDKGCLIAGQVKLRLGGGAVTEPMRLILGDRATLNVGGKRLDIPGIAIAAARGWFLEHLPRIDPDRHVRYQVELKPGSEELAGIFDPGPAILRANDTSVSIGVAPMTETEQLVMETEQYLNSPAFKQRLPGTGEDVKVLGVRTGRSVDLTVAMPLLDRAVPAEAAYFAMKEEISRILRNHLESRMKALDELTLTLNPLDREGAGLQGMYLSVLGTSAEHADSGAVGRGNDVRGLISMMRHRSSEAIAGKNPVSHVGKLYGVFAQHLAETLVEGVAGLREATVWMSSRIGEPVDRPRLVAVGARLHRDAVMADVSPLILDSVDREMRRIAGFAQELATGSRVLRF